MIEKDLSASMLKAKVMFASMVMRALGPQYEQAAEQLADRLGETITKYAGGLRYGDPDKRLEALGRAVGDTCMITLDLLAAVVAGRQ